jgi:hypothetical protein
MPIGHGVVCADRLAPRLYRRPPPPAQTRASAGAPRRA